jgi:TonB family protein
MPFFTSGSKYDLELLMKPSVLMLLLLLPWLFFACEKQRVREQAGQEAVLVSEVDSSSIESVAVDKLKICILPVPIMPRFPGGDSALAEYLKNHIEHPLTTDLGTNKGLAVALFKVYHTGKVGDIQIVKSVRKDLDSAFVEAIKKMPAWEPSTNERGKPQTVGFTLPLRFKLNDH